MHVSSTQRRALEIAMTVVAACGSSDFLAAQPVRVGHEFQVNQHTLGLQINQSAAMDDEGDSVVVWETNGEDGNSRGVFGRRFDAAGLASNAFQVNTYTVLVQAYPAVATDGDGDFVVVWESNPQDGNGFGIFGRRFDSAGNPLASELQVNTFTTNDQRFPDVAMSDDGAFVAAWASARDGDATGIFARRFDLKGAPLDAEFQVNSYTSYIQTDAAIAMDDEGDFVVVWTSIGQDGEPIVAGVFGKRYDSTGTAQGVEFLVTTYTRNRQLFPDVAMDADGDFVVSWGSEREGQVTPSFGIFARRFSSAGAAQGGELRVNNRTEGEQEVSSVAMEADGDFVVTWSGPDYGGSEVFGRAFGSDGVARTAEFRINTHTDLKQGAPSLGMADDGRFVVSWISEGQDEPGVLCCTYGVFAQRFTSDAPPALDVDSNGVIEPLTDGLLLLRVLFDFIGNSVTVGAIGDGCARCTASTIRDHVDDTEDFDIDGNGEVDPLTDGLLALRFLFGFTGDSLIAGAVANGCGRCTSDEIVTHLEGLI
jgi:hypothetical protein